ncbi:SRPBCC domain-containing protein [Portibacter lacus]|uniref:SRPBCC domain-containing protein n=1 Tax=Portibacter lacus TaxID=1099794 RepID=A0AA37SU56_9BACT|nr:SRPBCC domain-containing protein [Portibacter lacus]GLR18213.1 hypothetical protein GCM10007940_28280 [Portibacter lacus]
MRHSLRTEIKINAAPSKVWAELTNTESYPSWNPFIKWIKGDLAEGNRISAMIGNMKFKPMILKCEKNRELRWIGRLLMPGVFDGEHRFEIIDQGDGSCTLKHSEKFKGILVGMFKKKLDTETLDGFKAMNEALKLRCEE